MLTAEEQAAKDAADKATKEAADKAAADRAAQEARDREEKEKKEKGAPKDGPVDVLVQDMARVKKAIGLDEPPKAKEEKKSDDHGSLWITGLFG